MQIDYHEHKNEQSAACTKSIISPPDRGSQDGEPLSTFNRGQPARGSSSLRLPLRRREVWRTPMLRCQPVDRLGLVFWGAGSAPANKVSSTSLVSVMLYMEAPTSQCRMSLAGSPDRRG